MSWFPVWGDQINHDGERVLGTKHDSLCPVRKWEKVNNDIWVTSLSFFPHPRLKFTGLYHPHHGKSSFSLKSPEYTTQTVPDTSPRWIQITSNWQSKLIITINLGVIFWYLFSEISKKTHHIVDYWAYIKNFIDNIVNIYVNQVSKHNCFCNVSYVHI